MVLDQLATITPFITTLLTFYAVYLILSLSLNIIYGYCGIPNFGHVFFQSIGAYVAGNLTANTLNILFLGGGELCDIATAEARRNLLIANPPLAIGIFVFSLVVGAGVGGAFGYIASYPALRLKEDYLAITLIFIGEIGRIVARNEVGIACGLVGLTGIPNPFIWVGDPNLSLIIYTIVTITIAAAIFLYLQRLANSPFGRLLKSVRDDEIAAASLGKDVAKARGMAMIIGSAVAAVAGVLKVFYAQGVFADDYIPLTTFIVLSMVILGGMANNKGVILGALIITLLDFLVAPSFFLLLGIAIQFDITYIKYIITGVVIIAVLLFRPQGLIPEKPVDTIGLKIAKQQNRQDRNEK